MFTFLICLIILTVLDSKLNKFLKVLSVLGLMLLSAVSDCAFILPIAAILFRLGRGDRKKQAFAWITMCIIFFTLNLPSYYSAENQIGYALLHSFYAVIPWIASGIIIMYFYSGKKSKKHTFLNKWTFYIYYPLHLLILWSIRYFIM